MGMGMVMMTSMVDNGDYDGEAWWHVLHWSRHWQRGSRYLNHSICWSPYHTIVSAGHHTIPFNLLVTIPYHSIWSPYHTILSAGHHQCNAGYQITFQWRVLYNANCSALHLVSELVHCNLSAIHWYTPKYRVWFSALHLVSGPVGGWGANDITTFVSLAQTDGDVGGGRGGLFLLVIIILAMQVYTSF